MVRPSALCPGVTRPPKAPIKGTLVHPPGPPPQLLQVPLQSEARGHSRASEVLVGEGNGGPSTYPQLSRFTPKDLFVSLFSGDIANSSPSPRPLL